MDENASTQNVQNNQNPQPTSPIGQNPLAGSTPPSPEPQMPSIFQSLGQQPTQPIQSASVPLPQASAQSTEPVLTTTPAQPVPSSFPQQAVQPPPQPVSDISLFGQNSVQGASPVQQPSEEGPRITLNDLYGPSQQSSEQVSSQATFTPPAPVEQPVVPEPPQPPLEYGGPLPESPTPTTESIQSVESAPPLTPEQPVQPVEAVPAVTVSPSLNFPKPEEVALSKQPLAAEPSDPSSTNPSSPSSVNENHKGFRMQSVLKFLVGGIALLVLILVIWGISSLFFASKSDSGKVTLTYWGLWEDPAVMQPIIQGFEKQHPNITVTYTKEDPVDYTKRLLTRMQQGDGPDIFRLHNSWTYPLRSVLLPLPSEVISSHDLTTNYPPVVSQDMVSNGAVYGLPLEMDTLALFVNDDIFSHAGASVPTTWDNFITVAKALTVKDPNGHIQTAGAAIGAYDNIAHAPDLASLLLLQNGANLQKPTSSNAVDALSFYTSFASPDQSVWDATLDNSLTAFASGKVAMYFGYSYDILAIQTQNPNLHFSVHTVPHLPGRDMTIASYWAEGVSNRSQHPKEALEFMQYLAQKNTQTQLYTEEAKSRPFGELYARTDLAQGLMSNSLLAPFVAQYQGATSSIFAADTDYDEYNGALNQYLGNAINSILKDTSANSAAQTLSQGVNQVISTYAPKTSQ